MSSFFTGGVTLPTNLSKVKQFFWDVKDRRSVERGIGGYYNADTTGVSTTSTTRVNLKTYNFTSSANTNKIRVRVWGYASTGLAGYLYLNINETDVVTISSFPTTNSLLIDYIADITPNTAYTIKVDAVTNSTVYTIYVNAVYIIAGFGLTSTTSVNILSITLDSANDVYTLNVSGNFVYKLGIRWWVKGNRKTTALATITSNLTNEVQGYYSPSARDDGDNNAFVTVRTGDYATLFSISGYVGASGDTIIITAIFCQIILRAINLDSYNYISAWEILIKEKGIMSVTSRQVTIDGSSYSVTLFIINSTTYNLAYQSSASSDFWVTNLIFAVNDSPEVAWHCNNGNDSGAGNTLFLYVNIIVIGV